MTETKKRAATRMVPAPSHGIIPERDFHERPVLEARNLGIDFGGLHAVEDFNLIIGKTEIAGLIGPNGAGKTTVFNLLTKVYQPTMGTILLNGRDTAGMNTAQANKLGIARTFQNIRLFDNMSVEDNVRIGLHNQVRYGMFSGIFRMPGYLARRARNARARARSAEHFRYAGSGEPSGGQPALWRAAPTGNRPRAGDQPVAAAAGRTGGGYESA